jgi:hypothetical protein
MGIIYPECHSSSSREGRGTGSGRGKERHELLFSIDPLDFAQDKYLLFGVGVLLR